MIRRYFATALAAVLALASCVFASPAEARREWQAFGGRGDASTKIECPPGQVMVGFQGHTGAWIDQLRIMCAPLTGDFSTGGAQGFGGYFGGRGGGPNEATCPANTVLTKIGFYLSPDKGKVAIISLGCTDAGGNMSGGFYGSFGSTEGCGKALGFLPKGCDPGEGERVQTCPQEHFVGLTVRSGLDVNAIGVICDYREPPRAAPPPPPPPPPPVNPVANNRPIKTTGNAGERRPTASYLGNWTLNTEQGPFNLIMHEDEGGGLWGEFSNGDASRNGTLIGTFAGSGKMQFNFTYEQPQLGTSGSGKFFIFGNVFAGAVTTDGDPPQKFDWKATRK